MLKKSSIWLLILCLIVSVFAISAFANESVQYPDAEVTVMSPITLTPEEHNYMCWPSGDSTVDRPLQIVMNFKANDTLEEATASGYGDWKCDFYLTFTGLANGNITADNCYLAGNYGSFGWIVIPTDGLVIDEGVSYPVVAAYDANLTYENICDYVKDFTAAIYIDSAILDANPDFEVSLELKMTDPDKENNVITIGEPAVYDVEALTKPNADVTVLDPTVLTEKDEYLIYDGSLHDGVEDLPLQVVMNFKAQDSYAAAKASKYGEWICDFYLTFKGADGTFSTKDCYLAGNYGSFGWIAIPAEALAPELEYNVAYPVVAAYDPNLTYENICDYVKDFTAAIYISPALLEANPDFEVSLELRMTNPEKADDYLVVGEPAVFNAEALHTGLQKGNDINDLESNTQIGGTVDVEANTSAIESAKQELVKEFPALTEEQVANATVEIEIVFESLELVEGSAPASYSYTVSPMLGVGDSKIKVTTFDAPVTFRLPVHSLETKTSANVYHNGELIGKYDIKSEGGELFVEVSSKDFSTFTVEPVEDIIPVAKIGDKYFATLADAAAAAKAGDTIVLLDDATLDAQLVLPAGIILDGNGKSINGNIVAEGDITFVGHTKVTNFNAGYNKPTVTISAGACLEFTGTGRMVIGHGATFNIIGSIDDAKTADVAALTPSLIANGASFTGAGVSFNVTNAYIKFTGYCSSKNSAASGTFNFNITNSIWQQTGSLVFSEPTNGMDPTVNFNLTDSVLNTTSHIVFGVSKGNSVIDNSIVNYGANRQLENRHTLTIMNGSVVYAANATSSNAKNPGTLIIDNATYVGSGEFSGAGVGIGTLIVKNGANATVGNISQANVTVDVTSTLTLTKLLADTTVTVDASLFDGNKTLVINSANIASYEAIELVGCDTAMLLLDANGASVINAVAKIGDKYFATLIDAIAAVEDGDTILLLSNEVFTAENRTHNSGSWYDGIYYIGDKSFTIDLGGFTISQDGSVNDYLLNFKNNGTKANVITIKNGTVDAGTSAYCALCTSSSNAQKLTINLENIELINNNTNGSTVKIRGGATLNVNDGTVITGKNSYLAIECVASTVNINDGAEIYMNGTGSYNGCLVGACGGGVVNVYGGYGKGVKGGFIAMTSGGTINVYGGEWIANTNGTVTNGNNNVLTAQNNKNESGYVGASIINVYGGTFRGGMDAWILNESLGEKAELNISGGNFNAKPDAFLVEGFVATTEDDGTYTVEEFIALAEVDGKKFASVKDALQYALDAGITDLVLTLVGNTDKNSALALEDCFDLCYQTAFNSVTFKQADASTPYYIYDLYTGSRVDGGEFVFDGVNLVVVDQYMFEGNVRLTNNSIVRSVADANCFLYYSTTVVDAGSKLYGVIDDFRGGDLIIDGGRADGEYNVEADYQSSILTIRWGGDSLTIKNGAYVKLNASNEIGRTTITTNTSLNVSDSKLESWEYIENNGTINVDTESVISTGRLYGNGAIVIDASGLKGRVTVIESKNLAGFTGTITLTGNDKAKYEITENGLEVFAPLTIDYTNVTLTENFKMSFAFLQSFVADWSDYYVVITKTSANDGSVETIVVPAENWKTATIGGEKYYVVEYAGIAAKEMSDVASVIVYNADGVAVSETTTDSIKDYAMRKLSHSADDAKLATLLVDMLNYGAEAQIFFGYATDKLANADLSDEEKAFASEGREYSADAFGFVFAEGYDFPVANTLILDYNVQLKVGFDLRALELSDAAKIIVSYVNYKGETVTAEVSVNDFDYKSAAVYASCDTLTARDFGAKVEFKLVDGDVEIFTFTNSIEGFTARLADGNNKVDICAALMKYGDSAAAYFNK